MQEFIQLGSTIATTNGTIWLVAQVENDKGMLIAVHGGEIGNRMTGSNMANKTFRLKSSKIFFYGVDGGELDKYVRKAGYTIEKIMDVNDLTPREW